METNEIMVNEEVIETAKELAETGSSCKALVGAAGIGAAIVCGVLVYKFVAKPLIAKLKAKKNGVDADSEEPDNDDDEDSKI